MTKVRFVGGKVLFNNGKVVIREEPCCCGEPVCNCSTAEFAFPPSEDPDACECDGGTSAVARPDGVITINGNPVAPIGTCMPTNGDQLVFPCGVTTTFHKYRFVNVNALGEKTYLYYRAQVGYDDLGMSITLQTGNLQRSTPTFDPVLEQWVLTPPEFVPAGGVNLVTTHTHTWDIVWEQVLKGFRHVHEGNCFAECDDLVYWPHCCNATFTLVTEIYQSTSAFACQTSAITFTPSIDCSGPPPPPNALSAFTNGLVPDNTAAFGDFS